MRASYIGTMTRLAALTAALCLAAVPLRAEDETGLSLMERGAQMFLEGIRREAAPALEGLEALGPDLRRFAEQMGPALGALLSEVQDWSRYHPPEMLDNGDIILRRKAPDPAPEPDAAPPPGSVDL